MPVWLFPLLAFLLGSSGTWVAVGGRLVRMETRTERLPEIERKLDDLTLTIAAKGKDK